MAGPRARRPELGSAAGTAGGVAGTAGGVAAARNTGASGRIRWVGHPIRLASAASG
ncbi:MAG: hypothetical protein ACRDRK_18175 [Pseudonocardia sp.]